MGAATYEGVMGGGRRKARSESIDLFLNDKKSSGSVQSTKTSYNKEVKKKDTGSSRMLSIAISLVNSAFHLQSGTCPATDDISLESSREVKDGVSEARTW